MLYLYRRVIFGKLVKDSLMKILDLDRRELVVFAPLVLLVLWMGIYPSSFLGVMDAAVASLLQHGEAARAAAEAAAVAAR